MSELINTATKSGKLYRHLLSSASVLTFLGLTSGAYASEANTPTVWIELGGQLARVDGISAPLVAPFAEKAAGSPIFEPISYLDAQRMPRFSYEGEGELTFIPQNFGWVFSAGIRYGRSNAGRDFQQQTPGQMVAVHITGTPGKYHTAYVHNFFGAQHRSSEAHTILDFQAGKDIGLGASGATSILSAGVRFAQFTSRTTLQIHARPDLQYQKSYLLPTLLPQKYVSKPLFHAYTQTAHSERSFHGWGPSLSWSGSVPVTGHLQNGELDFDWGVNAAILFGRQRANVTHQTTGQYYGDAHHYVSPYHNAAAPIRSRTVTVPNVGGFAAISYRLESFKMSMGYRTDVFIDAMDMGIDSPHKATISFHGPFAKISIGLGG